MPHRALAILNSVPTIILRLDVEGRIIYANFYAAKQFQRAIDKLIGKNLREVIPPSTSLTHLMMKVSETIQSNTEVISESNAVLPNESKWYQFHLVPDIEPDTKIQSVICTITDITRLKDSEVELRRSQRRFLAFFEHAPAVAWLKDFRGRYMFISDKMAELFGGAERWLGRTDAEILPPEVAAEVVAHDQKVRETLRPIEVIEEVPTQEGTLKPWLVVKFPVVHHKDEISCGGIALDISERRRLEAEKHETEKRLYEAQKLESLGILAGGIAHDFNNLLTSILGYSSLATMELLAGRVNNSPAYLDHVQTAAARAADLCKQMLAYAGKGKFVIRPMSLTEIVEEMVQLLQAAISKKAVLRFFLDRSIPPVKCDATQIRQVVMNLITNASDAIGERSGVITVSTGEIDADTHYLRGIGADDLPPTRYVYLEIADTGCGMDEATIARIFEPFFTTKFTGRGLGLSAVQGIIRSHRGALKVYSEPKRGTTFKILLPSTEGEQEKELPQKPVVIQGENRLILVVDDEEDIRVFARKALELSGFRVITAVDGLEALELYAQQQTTVAAVVCDLTMPHLDGASTFRQLRKLNTQVRVILTSGFEEHEATAGLAGMGLNGFLRKPYRHSEFMSVLQEVLG